ncbi:MAG: T9SS type A sorting domain-containing protein [Armatimonadetes bacterium]|nr:T9SS type A sorting domain-containing protein [Armatimonadota bacterium]
MNSKTIVILVFTLFSLVFIHAQETIVDTIFVAGTPLTGEISNFNYNYELQVDFLALIMGDTGMPWIPPYVPNAVFRSYLTFILDSLSIGSEPDSIKLRLWTHENYLVGNDIFGEWPVWDIPGGDTIKCCVDHVDFGYSLDIGDWTAGDYGDPQTLETKCAFISLEVYSPETGYIIVDVTNQVINDIENERNKSQFRIGFEINTDGDSLYDYIQICNVTPNLAHKPSLLFYLSDSTYVIEEYITEFANDMIIIENYPNPFNPKTKISYQIANPGAIKLQIYNIKGQLIETLVNECQSAGMHSVEWNATKQSSGIYFYRIKTETQIQTGKCLLLK